ncbi:MAG: fibronectin type III domain-containing protein [Balneolaceae bacterium]
MRFILFILFSACIMISCGTTDSGEEVNGGGNGGGNEPPPSAPPPDAPGNLQAESGDEVIELSWDANSEDDLDGYNLYRSRESFSNVSNLDPLNDNLLDDTGFEDNEVENGETYYYRVTAVNEDDDEGDSSGEAEATPFAEPPGRP